MKIFFTSSFIVFFTCFVSGQSGYYSGDIIGDVPIYGGSGSQTGYYKGSETGSVPIYGIGNTPTRKKVDNNANLISNNSSVDLGIYDKYVVYTSKIIAVHNNGSYFYLVEVDGSVSSNSRIQYREVLLESGSVILIDGREARVLRVQKYKGSLP